MSDANQTDATRPNARRRLLRGSFALPTVLAVHNGSALAARSNQYRCVINDVTYRQAPPVMTVADPNDKWMRVQRWRQGASGPYFVKVDDLLTVATTAGISYTTNAAMQGTASSNEFGSGSTTKWLPWNNPASQQAPTAGQVLTADGTVAVIFSATGTGASAVVKVEGIATQGQTQASLGQGATTRSCWTSIK